MFTKIVDALYGIFHLEFFHFFLTPFCISSRLKSIHIAFFGCVRIELHGRNFRPLVWVWRPFHRCFVGLRRGWDTKSDDIIDVFITFLLLSYSTVLHQSVLIIGDIDDALITIDASDKRSITLIPSVDRSLTFKDAHYYFFIAPSLIMFLVFNLLPPLLLILYPMKAFQSCLSKCHLNSITLKVFVEKVQGCYRNGLDGGRDMRSFSGLYFLLQFFILIVESFAKASDMFPPLFLAEVIFSVTALAIALVKPYKKTYMACLDALILLITLPFCPLLAISLEKQRFPILQVLLCIPIIVFVLVLLQRKTLHIQQIVKLRCKNFNHSTPFEPPDNNSSQPLILPTSTVLSYIIYYPCQLYKIPFSFGSYVVLIFLSATLLVAIARPYKECYMNGFDILLLGQLTFMSKMLTDDYFDGMGTQIFIGNLIPVFTLVICLLYGKILKGYKVIFN